MILWKFLVLLKKLFYITLKKYINCSFYYGFADCTYMKYDVMLNVSPLWDDKNFEFLSKILRRKKHIFDNSLS